MLTCQDISRNCNFPWQTPKGCPHCFKNDWLGEEMFTNESSGLTICFHGVYILLYTIFFSWKSK